MDAIISIIRFPFGLFAFVFFFVIAIGVFLLETFLAIPLLVIFNIRASKEELKEFDVIKEYPMNANYMISMAKRAWRWIFS
jgi:ABC-type transport system involved in cytochrome bd biosynthesis fused ATPase/permease subunit